MAWDFVNSFQRWAGKRKGLLKGLVAIAVEESVQCIPGVGLAVRIVGELAKYGVDRLANTNASVPDVKEAGQAFTPQQLSEIEAWMERLTTVYGSLLDKLEPLVAEPQADADLTALIKQALQERADLTREFDGCLREVRRLTLSLGRLEAKLDYHFHEVRKVALSLEEIKAVFVEGPLAADWALLRQSRPDALQAVAEADSCFLAGQPDRGIDVLLNLLKKRGVGDATLSRHLGAAYFSNGNLEEAGKRLQQANTGTPVSTARLTTASSLTAASTRLGRVQVWRSLPRGFVVDRRYRIEAEVGRGGMGSVYRAVGVDGVNRGQQVALKVPAPHLMREDQTRKRFLREIEISRRLSNGRHPCIVKTSNYVVFDDPYTNQETYGLVMEYVEGLNLAAVLDQRRALARPLKPQEIFDVVKRVCQALGFAHQQVPPVFHRDVKPHNIMLSPRGPGRVALKLMDFGIARLLDESLGTVTGTGEVAGGTPAYMPPEFAVAGAPVDARSDVYMIGRLLQELMTLHPSGNPEDRDDCPGEWVTLIAAATNQVRSHRPASVVAFLAQMQTGLQQGSSLAAPQCSKCRAVLAAGAAFCIRCGTAAPARPVAAAVPAPPVTRCPRCAATLPPGAAACPGCGHVQARGPAQREPAPTTAGPVAQCNNPACGVVNPAGEKTCLRCGASLPTQPGSLLRGRYRIDKLLGMGGFSAIYAGTDTRASRPIVLKEMISYDQQEYALRLKFFRREAEILKSLEHVPGVVKAFDFFEQDRSAYLIIEKIDGEDLLRVMENNGGQPFPFERVVEWGKTVCDILHAMHTQDPPLVHRDLKPDNLMLLSDGRSIKMIDFGSARDLGRTVQERRAGKTQVLTEGYAPPEQIVGRPEARSDLFALAATLYHLLTGRVPEGVYTSREIRESLASASCPIPEGQRWLYRILAMNLSEEVNERYFSARELKRDLELQQVTEEVACPQCRTTNKVREAYCVQCSTPLTEETLPCSSCGKKAHLGSRYCPHCGNRLR